MRPTSITIQEGDEEAARAEGARRLSAGPDEVEVIPESEGSFTIRLKNAPGQVEIKVSSDRMTATITAITPPLAQGAAVSMEDVMQVLANKQVRFGIDRGTIEDTVKRVAASGEPLGNIVVAAGAPPCDGTDAQIQFRFKINGEKPPAFDRKRQEWGDRIPLMETVAAGDELALKTPASPPREGHDVKGEVLPGREPEDCTLEWDETVVADEDGLTFTVAEGTVGYADFDSGVLRVADPLRISEDRLEASLCIQPPSPSGKMLSRDLLAGLLEARGITHGIDWPAVERGLAQAAAMTEPLVDVLIARGNPPKHGEDARIVFHVPRGIKPGTLIEGIDRMDYRERDALHNVDAGELLAEKIPATDGSDGKDIFGQPLPARPGKDETLAAGENVEVSEDGLRFTAQMDGLVLFPGPGKVAVTQRFEVPSDVDYGTGNLNMDGTLRIKGWVRSGFSVKATGDISVEKGVEDAIVSAGVGVEVSGGFVGKAAGALTGGRDIRTQFIEGGTVSAGGDVLVERYIARSTVSAGGRIEVTGDGGRVMGGSLRALRGLEVGILGSNAGVKTLVDVGLDDTARQQLARIEKELSFYRRNRKKILRALSGLAMKGKRGAMTSAEHGTMAKLAKVRRQAVLKEAELTQFKKRLVQGAGEGEEPPVSVKVKKAVYAGTTVVLRGCGFAVREDLPYGGRFVLKTDDWQVEYTPE